MSASCGRSGVGAWGARSVAASFRAIHQPPGAGAGVGPRLRQSSPHWRQPSLCRRRTGGERYALAFFCDAQIDWPIAAIPTCVGPVRPPRYETTYYTDYMIRYQARTYNVFDD